MTRRGGGERASSACSANEVEVENAQSEPESQLGRPASALASSSSSFNTASRANAIVSLSTLYHQGTRRHPHPRNSVLLDPSFAYGDKLARIEFGPLLSLRHVLPLKVGWCIILSAHISPFPFPVTGVVVWLQEEQRESEGGLQSFATRRVVMGMELVYELAQAML